MDIITSFLYGMYYSGKLPSKAEYRKIASYLRSRCLVSGKEIEVQKQVADAIAEMHHTLFPDDEE